MRYVGEDTYLAMELCFPNPCFFTARQLKDPATHSSKIIFGLCGPFLFALRIMPTTLAICIAYFLLASVHAQSHSCIEVSLSQVGTEVPIQKAFVWLPHLT
ncbi:hypothetical protein BJ508DRAFT_133293 [Ascobolus immersus RN42]|uniref:Uncharacterized protein n=1 Tax=Ascobolus immersus RN42 TaxID=1160509 RepID=A0A3N4ILU9_ASCIM|nr:hypothetical protein BJ508DRAFT_133293 [Ascobolus immersus RN42]